jgi:hypothetical protein
LLIFFVVRGARFILTFRLFQQDLDRLQGWSCVKKYDLNAGKCKSISFSRGSKPVMFQFIIGDSDLKRVDVINDLGVLVDSRMSRLCLNQLKCWDL